MALQEPTSTRIGSRDILRPVLIECIRASRLPALTSLYVRPFNNELCGSVPQDMPVLDQASNMTVGSTLGTCPKGNSLSAGGIAGGVPSESVPYVTHVLMMAC